MKLIKFKIIIILGAFAISSENPDAIDLKKASSIKQSILKHKFGNEAFYKHPEYKKLEKDLEIELLKIRNSNFETDSIYKNQIKLIRMKHDSLVLKLFRELAKK